MKLRVCLLIVASAMVLSAPADGIIGGQPDGNGHPYVGATGGGGASVGTLPGDTPVPFWPHETGALVGTSETFLDVRAAGSYYDPSIGRRVVRDQRLDSAQANADRQTRAARAEREYLLEHLIDPERIRALRQAGSASPRTLAAEEKKVASPGKGSPVESVSDGFAWGAAGIGAGVALGLVVLLAGALVSRMRRQTAGRATT